MSRNRIILVTAGIMLSLFLASMESTVVATAMPTIVGQLGGLEHYSWVFSAFMLASTTAVPLYGKLSDIYGRRNLYVIAMALFLIGSVLCGWAVSMTQLIFARALQGIGAGGIMPLAFILIGEMFSLEQRAKMQGFFSGVWGVSSIAGPLLGGFIVDQLSWHWIFYINVFPGLIAGALVAFAWRDQARSHERPAVDYAGAALLTVSVITLLLGLMEFGTVNSWILLAVSVILFIVLWWVESRAADPILPIPLFRDALFSTATAHGFLTGWAVFGMISFIPLFVQSVLGANATQAGITITPMLLGWVAASIFGTRVMLTGWVSQAGPGRHIFTHSGHVAYAVHRCRLKPNHHDGLRHHDGHWHGAFHPRVCDRRANQRGTTTSRHSHFDDSIQPFHRRDSRRERDGRGLEHATRIELKRIRSGPKPGDAITRSFSWLRASHQCRRAHRDGECNSSRLRDRLRCGRAWVDRCLLRTAQGIN